MERTNAIETTGKKKEQNAKGEKKLHFDIMWNTNEMQHKFAFQNRKTHAHLE